MVVPNIWGQGQIFAFSAMDGDSFIQDDFVGTLSGDKVGIRFHTKIMRELAVTQLGWLASVMEIVASDLIRIRIKEGTISLVYAETNTVIGQIAGKAQLFTTVEGNHTVRKEGDLEIQDTHDGEYTVLLRQGDRFAFAFGKTEEIAIQRARKGMSLDLEKAVNEKLAYYEQNPLKEENPYARLYAKCLSVMKSQLYSPEGRFHQIWSTPDRVPHKNLWLWDSVFHAVGYRHLDTTLAQDLIRSVLDSQDETGFIPHMASPTETSNITQPPVLAWGAWQVYQKSHDRDFIKTVLDANGRFLRWCAMARRDTQEELYTWLTENDTNCRCGESGMDNSPRFDLNTRLQAIDFSCFMANEVRIMEKMAGELGDREKESYYHHWYEQIKGDINRKLWCEEDGAYYDYDLLNNRLHKVFSVASFLPLFAGICSETQAKALVKHLRDPEAFYTEFPIPCLSKKDPSYGEDMWRGPVWMNYNCMIIAGLEDYGYADLAGEIREKTLKKVNEWYLKKGTIYEFYDSQDQYAPNELNRKGLVYEPYDIRVKYQSVRDYGWSCTLCIDMLHR